MAAAPALVASFASIRAWPAYSVSHISQVKAKFLFLDFSSRIKRERFLFPNRRLYTKIREGRLMGFRL